MYPCQLTILNFHRISISRTIFPGWQCHIQWLDAKLFFLPSFRDRNAYLFIWNGILNTLDWSTVRKIVWELVWKWDEIESWMNVLLNLPISKKKAIAGNLTEQITPSELYLFLNLFNTHSFSYCCHGSWTSFCFKKSLARIRLMVWFETHIFILVFPNLYNLLDEATV